MTGPVGEVWADVRFKGDKAPIDVDRILDDAEKDGDKKIADVGDQWGETLDKHIKKETKNTGHDLARQISEGIEREGLKISKMVVELGPNGDVGRRWITTVARDMERTVQQDIAAGASGVFGKVGLGIRDAIGAGFNISGKSPLIAVLIPVFGAIVQLILSAVQAASALVAVLTVVPNLLFAIGLQGGVLFLVFHGLGEAITNAFKAENVEDFNRAISGLAPAAQDFVRDLNDLRGFFKELSQLAQQNFFAGFGTMLTQLADNLKPELVTTISAIASALGNFFREVLAFFASPVFQRFLTDIVPSITKFLELLAPQLFRFLFGLTTFGEALIPFLDWFGQSFASAIGDIGGFLNDLSHDKDFLNWLNDMKETWTLAGQAIGAALKFIVAFASSLNKAGGDSLLTTLRDAFLALAGFFASDEGVKALEGLITVVNALLVIFVGLVLVISYVLFGIQVIIDFLSEAVPKFFNNLPGWIGDFFEFLGGKIIGFFAMIGEWISNFVTETIPKFLSDIGNATGEAAANIVGFILGIGAAIIRGLFEVAAFIIHWIGDRWNDFTGFFSNLGGLARQAWDDLWAGFYNAGQNIVYAIVNGARSAFNYLRQVASDMAAIFRNVLPFSPAKEGPLSGSGDPMIAGGKIVQRVAAGIEMEAPTLAAASADAMSYVTMGPGAVQMNFYGPTPTTTQASRVGDAAGNSLADALAARNTRLSVRSLGTAPALA